jgi:ABC-type multidrug transport system fused ATPase/permease subunit
MDYDKILVLDKGQVSEYGSPLDLVKKEDGIFFTMCQETGEMEHLVQIAKESSKQK